MSHFICDVESDGPVPGKHSMVSFGIVRLDNFLDVTYYGEVKPISDEWVPEALNVSGFSREEHLEFGDPETIFKDLNEWVQASNEKGRPIFWSDNPAYDWQWMNYYFHVYVGKNPFGHSARRIGDLYSGLVKNPHHSSRWKKFRKTNHSHNALEDAIGNAEALKYLDEKYHLGLTSANF
jgi:DNA polymerase III epsilon subunit-like protein